MTSSFFTSWELWQKLSFFLALAMLVSFTAGLVNLHFTTRASRLHALLDEEKRAYLASMRAAGLRPSGRGDSDFPFGARALEMGIEVEGVWVVGRGEPGGERRTGGDEGDRRRFGPDVAAGPDALRRCRPAGGVHRSGVFERRRDTLHGIPDEFDDPVVGLGDGEMDGLGHIHRCGDGLFNTDVGGVRRSPMRRNASSAQTPSNF
ncbi:uncharacterized protein DNG_00259 [Cephalotrichum gorgonifer]|uniref:Uncharacterized protein n=1 Tax=Cephalotrichum gorgonifer TaxID=2041049 RepID=A0AAE8SQN1_9PEZI|nr:uncharacterized protein DNG_00259 [Cephalotrichum gorgonifer]